MKDSIELSTFKRQAQDQCPQVDAFLTQKTDTLIELDDIIANPPMQGYGSQYMTLLCQAADNNRWTLALSPDTSGVVPFSKLLEWYARFGFSLNLDQSVNCSLLRKPK